MNYIYKSNCQLKVTHLPLKTNLFFMKTIFIGSYKTMRRALCQLFFKN